MFGWFKPKSALSDDQRDWIDWRFHWLRQEFGEGPLRQNTVVPSPECFPESYLGTRKDAEGLFLRVCEYMRIDRRRIKLNFYHRRGDGHIARTGWNATGVYTTDESGQSVIWLEESRLHDAASIVATLAHEVAHVHLLGDSRLLADERDHEHLTDLLVIYFGLGVFQANDIRRDASWYSGGWATSTVETKGYLRMPESAYALALYAHLRGELQPNWLRYLRADVRVDLIEESKNLQSGQRVIWTATAEDRPSSYENLIFQPASASAQLTHEQGSDEEIESQESAETSGLKDDSDLELTDDDAVDSELELIRIADQHFTEGTILAAEGKYSEAVEAFTRAYEMNPDDSESLRERAVSQMVLGNMQSAIDDCSQRLKVKPDDGLALLCRAEAYLEVGRCSEALADLKGFANSDDRIGQARLLRGLAYFGEGDHKRAIREFTQAVYSDPHRADPYLARSRAYEVAAQPQLAVLDLKQAIDRNPDYADKSYRDSVLSGRMPFQRFKRE